MEYVDPQLPDHGEVDEVLNDICGLDANRGERPVDSFLGLGNEVESALSYDYLAYRLTAFTEQLYRRLRPSGIDPEVYTVITLYDELNPDSRVVCEFTGNRVVYKVILLQANNDFHILEIFTQNGTPKEFHASSYIPTSREQNNYNMAYGISIQLAGGIAMGSQVGKIPGCSDPAVKIADTIALVDISKLRYIQ